MLKKVTILIVMSLLITACQSVNDKEKAREFSQDIEALQEQFKSKVQTTRSMEEYQELVKAKNKDFENLLKKYEAYAATDEIDLLRAKVLLNLSKFQEAEKKIAPIIEKNSDLSVEAKMLKVLIMISTNQVNEAAGVFKDIEGKVKRGDDFFNAYLFFAMRAGDPAIKKEYSQKFLDAQDVPGELAPFKSRLYQNLSNLAKDQGDMDKAKEYLKKAFDIAADPMEKRSIESELAQLSFMGNPAPAINAEVWENSRALSLESLKGKVVVLDFWATWCKPCRMVMPVLIEEYEKHKDKGLVVIGFTKLYGNYSDEQGDKGRVDKKEEVKLIKEFVKRNKINYPVAVSYEGADFENYKITGIPTMVFINKQGNIEHIEVGVGAPENIKNRIKKLLEE